MKKLLLFVLLFGVLPFASAGEQKPGKDFDSLPEIAKDKSPAKQVLRFPSVGNSATPYQLTKDLMYVIDSDAPILVLASPDGYVKMTELPGPVMIRGKFVDGADVELRTYKGKQVFVIEAAKSGTIELLIIPQGTTKASDITRKMLVVILGPQPPPPGPTPDEVFNKAVFDAYGEETAADKAATVAKLAALYRQSGPIVNNANAKTTADVLGLMKKSAENLVPATALPKVRRAIADELNKSLSHSAPLDDSMRATISAQFLRIQTALEACK